jgi:hypothetical protein
MKHPNALRGRQVQGFGQLSGNPTPTLDRYMLRAKFTSCCSGLMLRLYVAFRGNFRLMKVKVVPLPRSAGCATRKSCNVGRFRANFRPCDL